MVESMVKGQISVQLEYTFTWPQGPSHVEIGGDFGLADTPSWALIPLDWDEHDCCFKKTLYLSVPRNLLFKFVVDGNWVCRPDIETRMDSSGNLNNFISLDYPLQKDFLKVPSQNHENHIEERVNALNNHPDVAVVAKADLNSSSAATNPTVEVISNIRKSEASDLSIL